MSAVPVLDLPAEILPEGAPQIGKRADLLLGPSGARLVIDLGHVEFLSSTGLGQLVLLGKRLSERGGRIALARPNPRIGRLLASVGLDGVLPAFATLDETMRHASGVA